MVALRDLKFDTIKGALALTMVGADAEPDAIRGWLHKRFGSAYSPDTINKDSGALRITDIETNTAGLMDRALFTGVRERALLFRMRGLRRTGFRTRTILTGGATATWIQQGKPIPVHKPTIDNAGLDRLKVAGMTVVTEQAIEQTAGIEEALFGDLAQATADIIDNTLLNPAVAGVAGVSPASLTNGLTAISPSADPEDDIATLIEDFDGDLSAAYFTMNPKTAAKLAKTSIGENIGVRGGELVGVPVLTGRALPTNSIALVDPTGIQAAWDEIVELETSKHGSVEMNETPTQAQPTGASLVSMWQLNLVALRAIAMVNWQQIRPGSVTVLQGAGGDWLDQFTT